VTARLRRDPRSDFCRYVECREYAKGEVWPVKIQGRPLEQAMRACARHLDLAEAGGAVVQRDPGPTRPSLGGCELRRPQ